MDAWDTPRAHRLLIGGGLAAAFAAVIVAYAIGDADEVPLRIGVEPAAAHAEAADAAAAAASASVRAMPEFVPLPEVAESAASSPAESPSPLPTTGEPPPSIAVEAPPAAVPMQSGDDPVVASDPLEPPALQRDPLMARADDAEALHLSRPEQLRTRLAVEPGRWRWQAPGTRLPHASDAAAAAWLDRLMLYSAQRWEPHVGPLPVGETVPWLREGHLEVELRLAGDGVLWRSAGGPALWQPMPRAAIEDLRRRF